MQAYWATLKCADVCFQHAWYQMAAYGTLMEAYCLLIDANDPESHLYRVQWLHYRFCENSMCPLDALTSKYIRGVGQAPSARDKINIP